VSERLKVVFDCNVFLQALGNPNGPAGRCVDLVITGTVDLYVSPQVLEEIRDVTSRPKLIARFKLRADRVAALLETLPKVASLVLDVPETWKYERDPDDAHYVNLALFSGARLIISRDKDLLDLMLGLNPEALQLLAQYPDFRVMTPPQFLATVDQTP
jgi:putative PIN family toxin of toxin-antitoxin system